MSQYQEDVPHLQPRIITPTQTHTHIFFPSYFFLPKLFYLFSQILSNFLMLICSLACAYLSTLEVQLQKSKFSSIAQSCPTLCDPMNCSMPGLPIHHQLLEFTQTHVHWVGDAIQPSHSLSSPSSVFNLSKHQGLFKWVSSSHQVAKILEFQLQHQSFQWTPRRARALSSFFTFISSAAKMQSSGTTGGAQHKFIERMVQFLVLVWSCTKILIIIAY